MSISILVEEELKAMKKIEEMRKKADEIRKEAEKEKARILNEERILREVEKYIQEQEHLLKKEADELYKRYLERAERIKNIPPPKIEEIVDEIIKEVLGLE